VREEGVELLHEVLAQEFTPADLVERVSQDGQVNIVAELVQVVKDGPVKLHEDNLAMHENPGSSVLSRAFTTTMHFLLMEEGAGMLVAKDSESAPVGLTNRKEAGPSKSIIGEVISCRALSTASCLAFFIPKYSIAYLTTCSLSDRSFLLKRVAI